MACAGKTLVELRQEVADCETRLIHLRAGAGMLSWGYFEKLVRLQNLEPDRSLVPRACPIRFPPPAET